MSDETRKPWEETWTAAIGGASIIFDGEDWPLFRSFAEARSEHAKLATAAPELARALLSVEWVNHYDGSTECPWCHALEEDGHDDTCPRQAALRKAGVR